MKKKVFREKYKEVVEKKEQPKAEQPKKKSKKGDK